MENEVQPISPLVQTLPQTLTPIPQSSNGFKILSFTVLGLAIVAGSVFIGIQIGQNHTPTQGITSSTETSIIQKCTSDKDCPSNAFCDYNTPGGEDSNGNSITGQPYGSQKCITKCQNNEECLSIQCKEFNILKSDTVTVEKGCQL